MSDKQDVAERRLVGETGSDVAERGHTASGLGPERKEQERHRITLDGWTKRYQQEPDDSTNDVQELVVEQQDAGGGAYWIIKTEHWAFNDLDELIEVLEAAGVERRKVGGT